MSKELEKEYLADLDHYDEGMGIHSSSYEKCKERLIRLAKIDNAKPSEAIRMLDDISYFVLNEIDDLKNKELWKSYFETIKNALLKQLKGSQYTNIYIDEAVNTSEAMEVLGFMGGYIIPTANGNQHLKDFCDKEFNTIKQALIKAQELEKVIVELCEYYGLDNLYPYDDLEKIEYALKNARDMFSQQRMELLGKLNKQEKENVEYKKVLEIIKKKCIKNHNLKIVAISDNYSVYCAWFTNTYGEPSPIERYKLTKEEFDLVNNNTSK